MVPFSSQVWDVILHAAVLDPVPEDATDTEDEAVIAMIAVTTARLMPKADIDLDLDLLPILIDIDDMII